MMGKRVKGKVLPLSLRPSLARQAGDNWDPLVSTTSGQDPHSGTSESSTWYGVLV